MVAFVQSKNLEKALYGADPEFEHQVEIPPGRNSDDSASELEGEEQPEGLAQEEENLELKDLLPGELTISSELQEKFTQIYTPQTYAQRKELLTWLIDNMRVQLIEFLNENDNLAKMGQDGDKMLTEINKLHHSM